MRTSRLLDEDLVVTPHEFITKWRASELKERSASQEHFIDLCRLLDEPTPAEADPTGESYCFERGTRRDAGGDVWADVWKRHHFAWEYKGRRANLDAAFNQLRQYALALENPPLLIVSDMVRFRIRTNWTNSVSRTHEFELDDLADAATRDRLKWAFSDPERLRPAETRQSLTERVAASFAAVAQALRERGHDPQAVAHFVNRLVFCMFADDVGLLPDHMFTRMLRHALPAPTRFGELAGELFRAMAAGGRVGFETVAWFNGSLFNDDTTLPLERGDLETVLAASDLDWSEIDPSILGTLLERGLDPNKRAQLGAHYTDRDKVMLLVEPVVVRPLLAEWEAEKNAIAAELERAEAAKSRPARTKRLNAAEQRYRAFLNRLRGFTVLDPACGSGNFLYLALQALKDIEHRVQLEAEALGGFQRAFPEIGPANVKGIEINPYATELARVSVWIGEIQWMLRNGFGEARDPILKPLDTIECRDAIVTSDGTEPEWPEADVVIGNPFGPVPRTQKTPSLLATTARAASWQRDFGIENGAYPGFTASKDELATEGPYSHGLRQAFELLDLDGVFCLEQTPLVYFKEVDAIEPDHARRLHHSFWNHGTAPILVLVAPDRVHVYSGMARPQPAANSTVTPRCLVDTLDRAADELQHFLIAVESGAYFREHAASFDADSRVDRDLLSNLSNAREVLRENVRHDIAQDRLDALLCRLVFACYLFDREVIGKQYLANLEIANCAHLREVLGIRPLRSAKAALYKLFRRLGEDFNGDLFSDDLGEEERLVQEGHLQTLYEFFQGTDVRTHQGRFWPYDFGYIPVETISAIYEHFLKSDQDRDGAFYTPRFLADIVLDTALEGTRELIGKTFLDPACGSGIFLVGLFNRLAWEWTQSHPNAPNQRRAEGLIGLLRDSLFGVDRSLVACRIAAFSLYLAYLDQLSPRDIQELQRNGPTLPRLVDEAAATPRGSEARPRNIVCTDFFSAHLPLPKNVDFVVGNPPWASVKREAPAARWCDDNARVMPNRQIATAFVWKAPEHARAESTVCFVLPHGTLFNHGAKALEFQKAWFEAHRVERVLNLTDLRFFLFRDAIHPALVVRYRNLPPGNGRGRVEYWAPKVSWPTTGADVVSVDPKDRTELAIGDVLKDLDTLDAPQVWKRHFWATPRDLRFLDRLMGLPRLRDHVRAPRRSDGSKRWVMAEGFQPVGPRDDESRAKRLELPSHRFIAARSPAIDLFLLPDDCGVLPSSTIIARQRSNSYTGIFEAPHVLVTQGFRRIAFADFDVSFRHAVRGIHGPPEDRNLLLFLACYLRTDLARYFTFHTSSNWGVYRPKVHVDEVLRVPLPLPDQLDDPAQGLRIVDEVCGIVDAAYREAGKSILHRADAVESASAKIEPLVREYFGIYPSEKVLIADTVDVVAPSAQPRREQGAVPGLVIGTETQGAAYTERLCATLNEWARTSGYSVRGTFTIAGSLGVGVVLLEKVRLAERTGSSPRIGHELPRVLRRIRDALAVDGRSWRSLREVMLFDRNKLYLLKPAARIHWTKTAAFNDADAIAAALLPGTRWVDR